MRFALTTTSDGSLTVFDQSVSECYKSRHAAKTEAEHVFYQPAIRENPLYGNGQPFRVLELGFGLGTNFLHFVESGFEGEFISIERDLAGAKFYLESQEEPDLATLVATKRFGNAKTSASLIEGEFVDVLGQLYREGFTAQAVLFDPFSPKANPESWTTELFASAAALLVPDGRLVTYSVSRSAKDSATAAGLTISKHKLPDALKKRSALLATKPGLTVASAR